MTLFPNNEHDKYSLDRPQIGQNNTVIVLLYFSPVQQSFGYTRYIAARIFNKRGLALQGSEYFNLSLPLSM